MNKRTHVGGTNNNVLKIILRTFTSIFSSRVSLGLRTYDSNFRRVDLTQRFTTVTVGLSVAVTTVTVGLVECNTRPKGLRVVEVFICRRGFSRLCHFSCFYLLKFNTLRFLRLNECNSIPYYPTSSNPSVDTPVAKRSPRTYGGGTTRITVFRSVSCRAVTSPTSYRSLSLTHNEDIRVLFQYYFYTPRVF